MITCFLVCVTVFHGVVALPGTLEKNRYQQPGDITLGGLFLVHYTTDDGECGDVFPPGLGHVQAMLFAIEKINQNQSLLPKLTLGYDIWDYCENAAMAMGHTYDFVRRNDIAVEFQNASCPCADKENITMNEPAPIVAVIGPTRLG